MKAIIWPKLGCGEDDVEDTGGGPDWGDDAGSDMGAYELQP